MSVSVTTLPKVEFNTLRKRVEETKSASTSRYYLAMLKRLEAYNQSPTLDLSSINADYIANFGDYLVNEGVTLSTVKLFKMAFRAVMKDAYGSDYRAQFKSVFKEVGSRNDAPTESISYEDLLKIVGCNLGKFELLERIRLVFLYCVFSGGLSLNALKESLQTEGVDESLPQQRKIIHDFNKFCEYGFVKYVSKLGDEQYSQALEAIGSSAGISGLLEPQSTVDSWIAIARKADISAKDMAYILPSSVDLLGNIEERNDISREKRIEILKSAANALFDMKPRWFVMRCYNAEPTEMDKIIEDTGLLTVNDSFSSFVPPGPRLPKHKSPAKKSLLGDMYFFNCASSTAANIRKAVREIGWVYTLAGTSTPAQISDNEMKTFMLLCDVSEGTLTYHFPDTESRVEDLVIGREATVINGDFSGQVGVIIKLPNNKYKVVMSFTSLCARVTAEIPVEFIKCT